MPQSALRRAVAMALFIAGAAFTAGCDRQHQGAVSVAVIGETPKIVDPAARALAQPEAVLLNNVAQGLVNYRKQHGTFRSVPEIRSCVLVSADLYRKIAPYLTI